MEALVVHRDLSNFSCKDDEEKYVQSNNFIFDSTRLESCNHTSFCKLKHQQSMQQEKLMWPQMVQKEQPSVPCVPECSPLTCTSNIDCKYVDMNGLHGKLNASTIDVNQLRPPSGGPAASVHNANTDARTFDVTEIHFEKNDIEYRGEGNSSIVVALVKEGKVIRLLKKSSNVENGEACDVLDFTRTRLQDVIRFESEILRRILNNNFLHKPQIIYLTQRQVATINSVIMPNRPHHRLSKSIPNQSTYALLLPDYCDLKYQLVNYQCLLNGNSSQTRSPSSFVATSAQVRSDASYKVYNNNQTCNNTNEIIIVVNGARYKLIGPVISTEIKPKQGFLPSIESLPADLAVKARVSRFCLKQFHKMKRGRISFLSHYCPLDLYSGCRARQYEAIENLLKTPQNNLRIFKNLKLVYGEEKRMSFIDVFSDEITHDSSKLLSSSDRINLSEKKVQLTSKSSLDDDDDDESDAHAQIDADTVDVTANQYNSCQIHSDDQNEKLVKDLYINLILKALNLSSNQSMDTIQSNDLQQGQCDGNIKLKSQSICHLHSSLRCTKMSLNSVDQINLSLKPKIHMNCNCNEHYLNSHSVLGCVFSAQKLDSIGSSLALDLTRRLYGKLNENLIHQLKSKQPPSVLIGSPCRLRAYETFDQFCFRKVWEFVVSLTAKDCSIMITMQRVNRIPDEETSSSGETSSSSSSSSSSSGNCDEVDVDQDEDDGEEAPSSSESSQLDMCESNDSCDSICPCQVVNLTLHSDKQTFNVTDDGKKAPTLRSNDTSNDTRKKSQLISQSSVSHESVCKSHISSANGLHIIRDDVTDQLFAIAIAITDLDPKLPATYRELERKINQKDDMMVQEFNELFANQLSHARANE